MLNQEPLGRTLLGGMAFILLGAGALREEVLKETDHKKIAKEVAAYWTAKQEVKGIQAAFDKLSETLDKTQSRLKDPVLEALVEDWERIFFFTTLELLDDKSKKGKVETVTAEAPKGGALTYSYHVSKKYLPKEGPYPMILIVPDEGVAPAAHLDSDWADPALRDAAILVALKMRSPVEEWSGENGVVDVMSAFSVVKDAFALDYDRIFLAGAGKGFQAAVATANAFPHLFAGLIGRGEVADGDADNLRNLPSILTSEGEGAQAFKKRIDDAGFGNCQLAAAAGLPELWAWVAERRRDSYPAHLTFSPKLPTARGAHWVGLERVSVEEGPRVDVQADRASNTITIDAERVGIIEVNFNDVLVDMDKPVKVIVNGTAHEAFIPRNRRTMIDLVFLQGDWGRVFTNAQSYDVK